MMFEERIYRSIKVLGCGGLGNGVLRYMMNFDYNNIEYMTVSTEGIINPKVYKIIKENRRFLRTAKIPWSYVENSSSQKEFRSRFCTLIKGVELIILVGNAGDDGAFKEMSIMAKAAEDLGVLCIGLVSIPCSYNLSGEWLIPDEKIDELGKAVDVLFPILGDELYDYVQEEFAEECPDNVLDVLFGLHLKCLFEFFTIDPEGMTACDMASYMKNKGVSFLNISDCEGADGLKDGLRQASANSFGLLSLHELSNIFINITGNLITPFETAEAIGDFQERLNDDVNIVWIHTYDEDYEGRFRITIMGTC